jgi:chromosome segregation ATPase
MVKGDISIKDIEELLESKQEKIDSMENMTKSSREKLKKLNNKLDEQESKLINIVSDVTNTQLEIDNLEDFNENENKDFSKKIKEVLTNMRKIRLSLADIVRKG